MVNRHIPTSLRLMPRASTWAEPANTCTDVLSNWRRPRRLSGLEAGLRIIRYTSEHTLAQRPSPVKITEVHLLRYRLA